MKVKRGKRLKTDVSVEKIFFPALSAIASDDQKFIRKMEEMGVPCLTPSALITLTWRIGLMDKGRTLGLLEKIRAMISEEEYILSKLEVEKGD